MFGSVTRQNIFHGLAPSESAACSSAEPCSRMSGISSRTTNGNVTKSVAITTPAVEKTSRMPCVSSHGPIQPLRGPSSRMKISPATMGDTAKGRSISETRNVRPLKSNFAIAHAITTPMTVLTGTTIAVVRSVSLMAATVSASFSAAHHTPSPLPNASLMMIPRGNTRTNPIVRTASVPTTTWKKKRVECLFELLISGASR